jgi:hypothetical protein
MGITLPEEVAHAQTVPVTNRATRVPLLDFEAGSPQPTVWVVNIPNDYARVEPSPESPKSGAQCLKLRYRFTEDGAFQYLGVPNKLKINAPVNKLRYWVRGDRSNCSYGVQLSDLHGETHQYSKNTGQCGLIDFQGWREVVIDLDASHETWGGDKNGKLDYPLLAVTFTIGQPTDPKGRALAASGVLSFDTVSVDSSKTADEVLGRAIHVRSPGYCSTIKGETRVTLEAPGFKRATVRCWKGTTPHGTDSTVATVSLSAGGDGSFVFPADDYPHGPLTLRISGDTGSVKDNCYLQLFNQGGTPWRQGIPPAPPPAAKGLKLLFADDFTGPLSISGTDPRATYYDHKPPNGFQDFSIHTFTSHGASNSPFTQVDTYLRIRASDATKSSGLISSLKNDGSGIKAIAPCYFECRFIGPNAIGAWPGFWLMTDYMTGYEKLKDKTPCDELDIIEAYGGEGPGSPNPDDTYMITPHAWNQGDTGKALETAAFEGLKNPIRMRKFGVPSTWFEAFHTFGCKITERETTYYCDDIEVGRHKTLPLSATQPHFFLVNLATGGGWPVDLSRYGGTIDMYIDYVRVYAGAK